MSRNMGITLVLLILSVIFCFIAILINSTGLDLYVTIVILSLLFTCFLAISIAEKVCNKISPYRIFAVVNICVGVLVAAYAIHAAMCDNAEATDFHNTKCRYQRFSGETQTRASAKWSAGII